MFVPSYGMVIQAVLLVAGIGWCVIVIRRLPSDMAELRELWTKLQASRTPEVTRKLQTPAALQEHRKECAWEFWTTLAIQVCFYWFVTFLVIGLFLMPTIWGAIARILGALR